MRLSCVALGAIILLAACHKTPAAQDRVGAASDRPAPASVPAAQFVQMAGAGDLFEIQAARIAEKRSSNPDVRAFAGMMVVDHTASTAEIRKALMFGAALSPPTEPSAEQQMQLGALKQAPAADFDRLYVDQQIDAHQGALQLMTAYAAAGDAPALKSAAADIAPVVQGHLDRIRAIAAALPKAAP